MKAGREVVWVSVSEGEAAEALASRTMSWAWRRTCVRLCGAPPSEGPVLALRLRPGGLGELERIAVSETFDPGVFASRAAHRLATRYAQVLSGPAGLSVRKGVFSLLERAVAEIEGVRPIPDPADRELHGSVGV